MEAPPGSTCASVLRVVPLDAIDTAGKPTVPLRGAPSIAAVVRIMESIYGFRMLLLTLFAVAAPPAARAAPREVAAARDVATCFTTFARGSRNQKALQALHACQMKHVDVLGLPALSDETAESARRKASCLETKAASLERVSKEAARKAGKAEGRELAFAVTEALLMIRMCQGEPGVGAKSTGAFAMIGSSPSAGIDDSLELLIREPTYRVEPGPLVLATDAGKPANPLPLHRQLRRALMPPVFDRCLAGENAQPMSLVVQLRADGTVKALPAIPGDETSSSFTCLVQQIASVELKGAPFPEATVDVRLVPSAAPTEGVGKTP